MSLRSVQVKPSPFKPQLADGTHKKNNKQYRRSFLRSILMEFDAFCRFSRPYTIIGSVVEIICVSFLPVESSLDLSPDFFIGILMAIVPIVLMNIHVVGLNQLYDVEIDKVNKPYLPIASGEYSMKTASLIVLNCFLLSFGCGLMSQSTAILVALVILFTLGITYSVDHPWLRWKRQTILATISIVIARALTIPFAVFIHIQKYVLHRPIHLTRSVIFTAAFTTSLVLVMSLVKDLPDLEGDKHFGMDTLTVRLGKNKGMVFRLCVIMLLTLYGGSTVFGAFSTSFSSMLLTVVAHSVLAFIVWFRAQSVDLSSNDSNHAFYMFLWKLFYVEYVLIQFIR